jgi:hypothetical protein
MDRRAALRFFGTAALAVPAIALVQPAFACAPPPAFTKTIALKDGKATIKHTLTAYRSHEWVLAAKAGETIEIKLTAEKATLVLQPDTAGHGQKPVWGEVFKDGDGVKTWTGTAPASGRILIEVGSENRDERYTLDIATKAVA